MGFSRQEYWSGLPFPSPVDHILSDLSTMTCPSCVTPRAWLSFIELDKAVVLVWLDWLVFCDYGLCVCPLMPSWNTYHLTWVSLTLGVGYLFMVAPAKGSRCSLPWTRGISSQLALLTLNVKELLWALLSPCSYPSFNHMCYTVLCFRIFFSLKLLPIWKVCLFMLLYWKKGNQEWKEYHQRGCWVLKWFKMVKI